MKHLNGKVAAITGAGSGIGRSLAVQLAGHGAHLALCDINQSGLEQTAALLGNVTTRVSLHQVDVADQEQMARFASEVIEEHQCVDLLFNNAGITLGSTEFENISHEHFEKVVQVNFWGTYYGIREFMPHLATRPEASIVNVSSLAGLVGLYGYAPYAVSKFAVRALSETLQSELCGSNISVTIVHPGGVKTNIIKNAPDLPDDKRDYFHEVFTKSALLTADEVARKIIKAVRRKRKRLIMGADAKIIYAIRIFFPCSYPNILRAAFSRLTFR